MTGEELKQQIALYESADHTVHLDVKVDEDTVWLNRQQLALLFGRDIKTIGKHVGNALRGRGSARVFAHFGLRPSPWR